MIKDTFITIDSCGNIIEFDARKAQVYWDICLNSAVKIERKFNKTQLTKYIKDYIDRKGKFDDV